MIPIRTRDLSVDYFKGLLVIGMVYTHFLQFFSDESIFASVYYSNQFFNLITFSGFVFCFGYVNQLAYYQKSLQSVYRKMLVTGLKTLVAFYLSGLAFQIYVGNQPLTFETIRPILYLEVIPGWSEFLVSFSLIILLGLVLFKGIIWLSNKPALFWTVCLLLLATTFINYSLVTIPQLGLLVGTSSFPTFPVIQYLPFYLIGVYFAKHGIGFHWKYLLGSLVGTAIFVFYLVSNNFELPSRFPPSIYWIVGPALILYLYYLLSKVLGRFEKGLGLLRMMGENVLLYLLLSNIFIFSLDNALGIYFMVGPWKGLFCTFILLLVITYLIRLTTSGPAKSKNTQSNLDTTMTNQLTRQ